MGFQSTVFFNQGLGVVGELFTDTPYTAESYIINTSGNPQYNVFGRALTVVSGGANLGSNAVVMAGGTGVYVGIMANPKEVALFGTAGAPLAPTLTVPNYTQIQAVSMGKMVVALPASCNIGDWVLFNNTTGVLSTVTPGSSLPSGYTFANAIVDFYDISAGGLAIIAINPTYVIPQP